MGTACCLSERGWECVSATHYPKMSLWVPVRISVTVVSSSSQTRSQSFSMWHSHSGTMLLVSSVAEFQGFVDDESL